MGTPPPSGGRRRSSRPAPWFAACFCAPALPLSNPSNPRSSSLRRDPSSLDCLNEREDDSTSWGSHLLEDARVHDGSLRPPRVAGAGARVAVLVTAASGLCAAVRVQNGYVNSGTRGHGRPLRELKNRQFPARTYPPVPASGRVSLTRSSLVMKGSPVRVRASASQPVFVHVWLVRIVRATRSLQWLLTGVISSVFSLSVHRYSLS
jgi:hypothetical protein